MPGKNKENIPEIVVHWDRFPVTSGIFAGLTVQEARDLNQQAEDEDKPIEKVVQEYRKKKAAEEKKAAKKPAEPTPEPKG